MTQPGKRLRSFAALALFLGIASALRAEEPAATWPQWRGPDRTAVSKETGLLKEWPKEGPPLLWKATGLGEGHHGISTDGQRIYTIGADPADTAYLRALDMNGKVLWSAKLGKSMIPEVEGAGAGRRGGVPYAGPRSTPTVDRDLVFALGPNGEFLCAEAATGKEVWLRDLEGDLKGTVGKWGYCESPLVDGNLVIVAIGGKHGTAAALDRKTGIQMWRKRDMDDFAAYSSAIAGEIDGEKQYIFLTDRHLFGVAAESGEILWKAPRAGKTVVPTPILSGNQVFVTSGYGTGCNLFRITKADGGFAAEQVYANKNLVNHHGGVLLIGNHVYGTDEKELKCLDLKTGEVTWSNPSVGKGSIVAADGHLYVRNENGPVALVEATPEGYREKGRFDQPGRSGKKAWPHPVVVGGRLYLRDQDILLCYDVKEKN